jgi:IS30 family transposase
VAGDSLRTIATRLGRAPSTVSREVAWRGSRDGYRAWQAEEAAIARARRPKLATLAANSRLRREVERGLRAHWSPEQIAARLVCDYPDDPAMRVSHETIYRTLFVQSRGALREGAQQSPSTNPELDETIRGVQPSEVFSRIVASIG